MNTIQNDINIMLEMLNDTLIDFSKQMVIYYPRTNPNVHAFVLCLLSSVLIQYVSFKIFESAHTRDIRIKMYELSLQYTDAENENADLLQQKDELSEDVLRMNRELTEANNKIKELKDEIVKLRGTFSGYRQSAEQFLATFPQLDTQG